MVIVLLCERAQEAASLLAVGAGMIYPVSPSTTTERLEVTHCYISELSRQDPIGKPMQVDYIACHAELCAAAPLQSIQLFLVLVGPRNAMKHLTTVSSAWRLHNTLKQILDCDMSNTTCNGLASVVLASTHHNCCSNS